MISFADMTLDMLIAKDGYDCACGRHHGVDMDYLSIKSGAVREIPQALAAMGKKKPFIICDRNTKAAAWDRIEPVLKAAGIEYVLRKNLYNGHTCLPRDKFIPVACKL